MIACEAFVDLPTIGAFFNICLQYSGLNQLQTVVKIISRGNILLECFNVL